MRLHGRDRDREREKNLCFDVDDEAPGLVWCRVGWLTEDVEMISGVQCLVLM